MYFIFAALLWCPDRSIWLCRILICDLIGNRLGWGGAWGVKCSDQRQARVRVGDSHHSQNMVGVIWALISFLFFFLIPRHSFVCLYAVNKCTAWQQFVTPAIFLLIRIPKNLLRTFWKENYHLLRHLFVPEKKFFIGNHDCLGCRLGSTLFYCSKKKTCLPSTKSQP